MMSEDNNRYTQLAAAWGVEVNDASIQLLKEFDRQITPLLGQANRLDGNVTQWTSLTTQMLTLSQSHMTETKSLGLTIKTLTTASDNLSRILQSFEQQIESQKQTLSQLRPEVTSLSKGQQEIGASISDLPKVVNHSEGRIVQQIGVLKGRALLLCLTPLVLAAAIGGLSYYFGHKRGWLSGQAYMARTWFGGVSNTDYWKQLRNANKDRMKQCLDEGRSECTLDLP